MTNFIFFFFVIIHDNMFTVVAVSPVLDVLPLRDIVDEYRLFKNDVCAMSFCRWWTRYVCRQLNKPVILSANAGHFGGTSNMFYILNLIKTKHKIINLHDEHTK